MSDSPLTVLADLRWPPHTGIGQVQEAYLTRKPDRVEIIDLGVKGPVGSPLSPLRIARAIQRKKGKGALFWSAGFMPPLFRCGRAVVFVHDLTHLKYYNRLRRIYYAVILRALYRRCAAVVCVSNYTRGEFLAWSGADPEKVHVIRNAVANRFLENKAAHKPFYQYVLYPGNHRSYKNVDRLIEAYARSNLGMRGIHLLLTGDEHRELRLKIDRHGVRDLVHFCGRVPSEQLPQLYRGAEAIVFVSLYEGFGLPILEGMASGVPVVTSVTSAMPEVAGDAALIVNPYSVDAIARGMERITTDEELRRGLVEKGQQRLREFSWDVSAGEFWRLMTELHTQGQQAAYRDVAADEINAARQRA